MLPPGRQADLPIDVGHVVIATAGIGAWRSSVRRRCLCNIVDEWELRALYCSEDYRLLQQINFFEWDFSNANFE
jgi:hypothetical protein